VTERRALINVLDPKLSISQQCRLLNLSRSTYYYEPAKESDLNLELMSLMDKHYLEHPYKGGRRMYVYLKKDLGYEISLNRVNRLYYKVMGLRAIFPGPHTSKRRKDHKVYPYLLRELAITHPNQVWATDITYLPMPNGYMYLMAIIDLYSRYVVHWSLSNTMDAAWCANNFLEAIEIGVHPQIINTDQGSQFTSKEFTEAVLGNGIKLSMDGKGRATDNAFIESLWKLVKYEYVYLYAPSEVPILYKGLTDYFYQYNTRRRHSSIDDKYPIELYDTAI